MKGFLRAACLVAAGFCGFFQAGAGPAVAATFSGDLSGGVIEDAARNTVSGKLVAKDADGNDLAIVAQTNVRGKFGVFRITAAGAWTYTLDNSNRFTDALWRTGTGEFFTADAADGTQADILIYVGGRNDPPIADAGPDRTATSGGTVTLTGRGSDPETRWQERCRFIVCPVEERMDWPVAYKWEALSSSNHGGAPLPALRNDATASPVLDLGAVTRSTILTVRLTVTDRQGRSDADTMEVRVVAPGGRPARFSFFGRRTGEVREDEDAAGKASGKLNVDDPDAGENRVVAQTGARGTYGVFSITAAGAWTYRLDNADPDTNLLTGGESAQDVFRVRTVDGSAAVNVVITVRGANDPPVADAGSDRTVGLGQTVQMTGRGRDPERQHLTYSWSVVASPDLDDNQLRQLRLRGAATARAELPTGSEPNFSLLPKSTVLTVRLTVTDADGASGTDMTDIRVIVNQGAPAVFGGDLAGSVTEDSEIDTVDGTLTVADPDGENLVWAQGGAEGTYGSFSIAASGNWTYTLDNADPDTDMLAVGARVTESFPVIAADGTRGVVTITVTGANDPAAFDGDLAGAVAEDSETDTAYGTLTATDTDGPDQVVAWRGISGTYGSFSITKEGEWIYSLDNADPDTDALAAGARATDVFPVEAADGTATEVTIAVTGANDPPSADAGEDLSVAAGEAAELNGGGSEDPESGTLTWLWTVISSSNTKAGRLRIKNKATENPRLETGAAPNDEILTKSTVLTVGLTVTDPEGASATDTVEVRVIVRGDAAAVFGGDMTGDVTEDAAGNTASGKLTVRDEDGLNRVAAQTGAPGTYGVFSIAATGEWTYRLDNADPDTDALGEKETATDVFPVTAADGAVTEVTITVTGANDPAAFAGDRTGRAREHNGDRYTIVRGKLAVRDPDGDDLVRAQTGAPGTYGVFSIAATGEWTYTLDNADPDTDALPAGVLATDVFPVTAADGAATEVTITVIGANDPAAIAGDLSGAVTEDAAADTVRGTLTVTDPDEWESRFRAQDRAEGTYGVFSIAATGEWTYTLDNARRLTNSLRGGAQAPDQFRVESADGARAQVVITVTGMNDPPSADAGPDRRVNLDRSLDLNQMVRLTGWGSDPEGLPLVYQWKVVESSNTRNIDPPIDPPLPRLRLETTNNPEMDMTTAFNQQRLFKSTILTVQLTVTDRQGSSDTDTMNLIVILPGPGESPAIVSGDTVGKVTENAVKNWVGGKLTVIKDDDGGQLRFAEQSNTRGTYGVFSITASRSTATWLYRLDNADPDTDALREGESATDVFKVWAADGTETRVTITVIGAEDRPVANAGPNLIAIAGKEVKLAGRGSDPSGDPLTFAWEQTGGPAVTLAGAGTATATFTAPSLAQAAVLEFKLTVKDNKHGSDEDTAEVLTLVCAPNPDENPVHWDRPQADYLAVANAGRDRTVGHAGRVTLDASASCEPGGKTLYFHWRQTGGEPVVLDNPKTATPSFTAPDRNTELIFELEASDRANVYVLPSRSFDTVKITVRDIDAPDLVIKGLPEYISMPTPVAVTFRFSKPVQGFRQDDVRVANARLSAFTGDDGGNVFDAIVTPDGNGDVVLRVAAGVAQDLHGNPGPPAEVTARAKYIGLRVLTLVKRVVRCNTGGGNCNADAGEVPPGSVLRYRVGFTVPPDGAATGLDIHDRTPAWTSLYSRVRCPADPPAGTVCRVVSPPASENRAGWRGALHWRFAGRMPPGGKGAVVFKVQLDE